MVDQGNGRRKKKKISLSNKRIGIGLIGLPYYKYSDETTAPVY